MTTRLIRSRITLPVLGFATCAMLAATHAALAQQAENPGDIIVERQVMPRIAYRPVPKQDNPVTVRATTFPADTFDPVMANLVSDADLVNAHGSNGVAGAGPMGSAMSAAGLLRQSQSGGTAPVGANAAAGSMASLGTTISQSVTGALAPMMGVLGGAK
jgi:hypothetical protein